MEKAKVYFTDFRTIAGGDGLPDAFGIVHFCGRAEKNLLRPPARGKGGLRHPAADFLYLFGNHSNTFPSYISSEVRMISSSGQRFSVLDLSSSTT